MEPEIYDPVARIGHYGRQIERHERDILDLRLSIGSCQRDLESMGPAPTSRLGGPKTYAESSFVHLEVERRAE